MPQHAQQQPGPGLGWLPSLKHTPNQRKTKCCCCSAHDSPSTAACRSNLPLLPSRLTAPLVPPDGQVPGSCCQDSGSCKSVRACGQHGAWAAPHPSPVSTRHGLRPPCCPAAPMQSTRAAWGARPSLHEPASANMMQLQQVMQRGLALLQLWRLSQLTLHDLLQLHRVALAGSCKLGPAPHAALINACNGPMAQGPNGCQCCRLRPCAAAAAAHGLHVRFQADD